MSYILYIWGSPLPHNILRLEAIDANLAHCERELQAVMGSGRQLSSNAANNGSGFFSRRYGLYKEVVQAYKIEQTLETQDDLSRLVQASVDGHIRMDSDSRQKILCEDINFDVNMAKLILAAVNFFFPDLTGVMNADMGDLCFKALDECGYTVIMLFKVESDIRETKISLSLEQKRQLLPGGFNFDKIKKRFEQGGLDRPGVSEEERIDFISNIMNVEIKSDHPEYTMANIYVNERGGRHHLIRKAVPKTSLVQLTGSGVIHQWDVQIPVKADLCVSSHLQGLSHPYHKESNHEAHDLIAAAIHHFMPDVIECRLAFEEKYVAGYCCWFVKSRNQPPRLQFFEVDSFLERSWKLSTAGHVSLGRMTTDSLMARIQLLNGTFDLTLWNDSKWTQWNRTAMGIVDALNKEANPSSAVVKEQKVIIPGKHGNYDTELEFLVLNPFINMVNRFSGILHALSKHSNAPKEQTLCSLMERGGCDKNSLAITSISHFFPEYEFTSIRQAFSNDIPGIIQATGRNGKLWLFVFSYSGIANNPAVFKMNLCRMMSLGDLTLDMVRSRIDDRIRISEMCHGSDSSGKDFAKQLLCVMDYIGVERNDSHALGARRQQNGVEQMYVPMLISCDNDGVALLSREFKPITDFAVLVLKGNGRLSDTNMLPFCDNVDESLVDRRDLMKTAISHSLPGSSNHRLAFGNGRPLAGNCYIVKTRNDNHMLVFFKVYTTPSLPTRISLFIDFSMEMQDGNMESLWKKFQRGKDMSKWDCNMFAAQLHQELSGSN